MAIFHLDVKTGTRGGGQTASAKYDYLGREGRYAKDAAELEYKESGNMPKWAEDDPGKYWQAADEHERTNGRQRRDLARSFARQLTDQERLPYTLAIHRGESTNPDKQDNPHAHLVISERGLDGHDRSAERWFKRANKRNPERGGAKKSSTMMARTWVEQTRQVWAREANRALERACQEARVDHRTLAAQREEALQRGDLERAAELSREPSVHRGLQTRQADSTVKQRAVAAEQSNRDLVRERREINERIGRAEREIFGDRARLKETYERIRTAIDERIEQAGRAIRTGSEAVGRAGTAVGRAASDRSERVYRVEQAHGRASGQLQRICQHLGREIQRNDPAYGKAVAVICPNIEQLRIERGRDERIRLGDERGRGRDRDSGPSL